MVFRIAQLNPLGSGGNSADVGGTTVFTLTIKTDNAAFDGVELEPEIARILRRTADRVLRDISGSGSGSCRDSNGNTVGKWELTR